MAERKRLRKSKLIARDDFNNIIVVKHDNVKLQKIWPKMSVEHYLKTFKVATSSNMTTHKTLGTDPPVQKPVVTPIIKEEIIENEVQIKQEIFEEEIHSLEESTQIALLKDIKVEVTVEENNLNASTEESHNDELIEQCRNINNGQSICNREVENTNNLPVNIEQDVLGKDGNVPELETLVFIENIEIKKESEDIDEEIARIFRPSQRLLDILRKSINKSQENLHHIHVNEEPIDVEESEDDILATETNNDTQESLFSFTSNQFIIDDDDSDDVKLKIDLNPSNIKELPTSTVRRNLKIYRCKMCNFEGIHKDFKIHKKYVCIRKLKKREVHPNQYKCSKCDVACHSFGKFIEHQVCHGLKKYTCPQCFAHFSSPGEAETHVKKHIKDMFYRVNIIDLENENIKFVQCKNCKGVVFSAGHFLHWEEHLHTDVYPGVDPQHLDNSVKPVPVKNNDEAEAIQDVELLKDVLRFLQVNTIGMRTRHRSCMVCGKRFQRNFECKRHLIEHLLNNAYWKLAEEGGGGRGLACQICERVFMKSCHYKHHMREHASLPEYKCDLCNSTFSDSSNFCKHKKVHNLIGCRCDYCNKKFQMKASLEKHIITVHRNSKPLTCAHCPKIFYIPSSYRKHLKNVHEKRRPTYQCRLCKKQLSSVKQKWDHMWYTHEQRSFKADCHICHKPFRKYLDMKRHILAEHGSHLMLKKSEWELETKISSDHSCLNVR